MNFQKEKLIGGRARPTKRDAEATVDGYISGSVGVVDLRILMKDSEGRDTQAKLMMTAAEARTLAAKLTACAGIAENFAAKAGAIR